MAGRSNGLRFLVIGIGGLWSVIGLTGCSFTWHENGPPIKSSLPGRFDFGKGGGVSETYRKTYAALKVKTLRVRDEMGAIEIKPAEEGRDEIRIEATKSVEGSSLSASDRRKLLAKVKITAHLDGDVLVIEADHEKDGFPDSAGATVAFVISVPTRLALDLRTDNAPITLTMPQALSATVDAQTSNGNVTLEGLSDPTDRNADSDRPTRHLVLNGGKAVITARTSNDSIALESR